jgi:hypothetical protein
MQTTVHDVPRALIEVNFQTKSTKCYTDITIDCDFSVTEKVR